MGEDSARAIVLRTLVTAWQQTPEQVAALADGSRFAPASLTDAELTGLARELSSDAPTHIRGDYPEWLDPVMRQAFGERAAEEGAALAARAPVDLRTNTLKSTREKVLKAVERFKPTPARHIRLWGCVSRMRRDLDEAHMSRPRPRTARAGSRCRTRARK